MIRRFLYFIYRVVHRLGRWILGRFTPGGLLVLAGLAVTSVFGLDTNRTMAYQAFTFLAALLGISLAASLFFRPKFTGRRSLPRFATVGETLSYRILIHNMSRRSRRGLLLRERLTTPIPTFEEFSTAPWKGAKAGGALVRALGFYRWRNLAKSKQAASIKEHPLPDLLPGGEVEVRIDLQPRKRGVLNLTGLTIARPDPLGLFKAVSSIDAPQTVLVLPKRYELPPISLPGLRKLQPGGVSLASSVGDSEEFISVRDYRPGDPLRRIHWKSWAKTGKPIVKEYQEEYFVRHALVLDTFREESGGQIFEEAVSVAASFAAKVQTQESLLDLMFVGPEAYCFTSGRGLAHTDKMLEILASVQLCRDKSFNVLFPLVLERVSLLSGCICIFLSWDDERKEFINRLKGYGLPLKVLIITDPHFSDTLDPGPMKDRPDNFHQLAAGRVEEGLMQI